MESAKKFFSSLVDRIRTKSSNLSKPQKIGFGIVGFWFSLRVLKYLIRKPKSLAGEIVFITGGASGLGKQLAILLSREGAKIAIADIDINKANEVAELILSENNEALGVFCDVTSIESIKKAASTIRTHLGSPSILINNDEIMYAKPFLDLTPENIEKTFKVNVISHFYTIKEFLPNMIKNNKGHIVTISSSAGIRGLRNLSDYSASKSAAISLDESLRNELVAIGSEVQTTCISPFVVNNAGNGFKSKINWILPALQDEKVAKRIVLAIKFNEKTVTIPKILDLKYVFKALLTEKNYDRIAEVFGVYTPEPVQ